MKPKSRANRFADRARRMSLCRSAVPAHAAQHVLLNRCDRHTFVRELSPIASFAPGAPMPGCAVMPDKQQQSLRRQRHAPPRRGDRAIIVNRSGAIVSIRYAYPPETAQISSGLGHDHTPWARPDREIRSAHVARNGRRAADRMGFLVRSDTRRAHEYFQRAALHFFASRGYTKWRGGKSAAAPASISACQSVGN